MMPARGERAVRLSDGAEAVVKRWGERGRAIVAVHGLGASRMGWARIGERLAGRYRLFAYDQRGHGDSAHVADMRFPRSVRDCLEVIAALGEPVHALLGHSWGGAVAIAAGRAVDVARVVAIEPLLRAQPATWTQSVLPEFRAQLARPLAERERTIRAANAGLPEIEIEAKLFATRRLGIEAIEALGRENGIDEGRWDLRALLDDYPRPLLLAVADAQRTVVDAEDRAYARERGGPNVRVVAYPGASHSLQRDAFERFIPDLEAFLG